MLLAIILALVPAEPAPRPRRPFVKVWADIELLQNMRTGDEWGDQWITELQTLLAGEIAGGVKDF